jgi:uncharacterized protein YecE (DUF72 family)
VAGTVRVGISGWTYAPWRGDFYPKGLLQRDELRYAAERLDSIEINGSFYSLQRPSSYASWRDQTPETFVFAVKGGRFITHMKRLLDAEQTLANFFASGPLLLGAKLGPFLWQLPPTMVYDEPRLGAFLQLLPRTTTAATALASRHDHRVDDDSSAWTVPVENPLRHALEVRHGSFAQPRLLDLTRRHEVALVVADSAGRFPFFTDVTSDHVYVRLHGAEELYVSGYDDRALDEWAARITRWADEGLDVFVYFDNDAKGYAPWDALRLRERLTAYLPHCGDTGI